MPQTHVPVLAGELIEALDPKPGQIAVDCTLGAGGHARLVADRIGPTGTLIAIDRDPNAEAVFAQLSAEVACETRFIRADFVSGLAQLIDEGVRADVVYMDLGMSSMQVDNRERGFAYAYDAPLDMRMDPDQELTAAEIVNTWDRRRRACSRRRSCRGAGQAPRSAHRRGPGRASEACQVVWPRDSVRSEARAVRSDS